MAACDEREKLRTQLNDAFQAWYPVKDAPGGETEAAARKAETKVHHLSRALSDHCAKHGCTKESLTEG